MQDKAQTDICTMLRLSYQSLSALESEEAETMRQYNASKLRAQIQKEHVDDVQSLLGEVKLVVQEMTKALKDTGVDYDKVVPNSLCPGWFRSSSKSDLDLIHV
jgi:hypothetical protein